VSRRGRHVGLTEHETRQPRREREQGEGPQRAPQHYFGARSGEVDLPIVCASSSHAHSASAPRIIVISVVEGNG
jgi:hypothetical protein